MNPSYVDFARFYDLLTENVDYEEIAGCYCNALLRYGTKAEGSCLLDIACGSGSLSVIMESRGYTVTGVDISEEMLTAAAAKSDRVRRLCLDMTKLPFEAEFDAAVCCLDGINHLEDLAAIQKAFDGIYRSLKKGGVFAADLNTPYKHLKVLADNAFIFDYEGLFCSWQNELDRNSPLFRVDMYLDFFKENENGSYTRYADCLSEIAPTPEIISQMLMKSGFTVKETAEFPTMGELLPESEKYIVIAKKSV